MPNSPVEQSTREDVLVVQGLKKYFPVRGGLLGRSKAVVHAVDGISFSLKSGETLGLVGESGSGKSTVGRCLMRLLDPTDGNVSVCGQELAKLKGKALWRARRNIQMIFQDPYASLNPRLTAGSIVAEPMVNYGTVEPTERARRVMDLFDRVGLRQEHLSLYPHEFSGGQRQRLGIARALALDPKIIVSDEATSALDVSVQAQVLNLMSELQEDLGVSYLFISHDLAVVEYISHRIAVMYLGEIIELGTTRELFDNPLHPYTQGLLAAVHKPDPDAFRPKISIQGEVPSPITPPNGCRFHTRCPYAQLLCKESKPQLKQYGNEHWASCHLRDGSITA